MVMPSNNTVTKTDTDANANNLAHTDAHANANTHADAHANCYADAWCARPDAACGDARAAAVRTRVAEADRFGWARDARRERITFDSERRRSGDHRPRD